MRAGAGACSLDGDLKTAKTYVPVSYEVSLGAFPYFLLILSHIANKKKFPAPSDLGLDYIHGVSSLKRTLPDHHLGLLSGALMLSEQAALLRTNSRPGFE